MEGTSNYTMSHNVGYPIEILDVWNLDVTRVQIIFDVVFVKLNVFCWSCCTELLAILMVAELSHNLGPKLSSLNIIFTQESSVVT